MSKQNLGMKKTLLSVLALIAAGCADTEQSEILSESSEQVTPSGSCAYLSLTSPLEDVRSCAEQGDANARFQLGSMYADGRGLPEDDEEAVRWYQLAAELGDANAQFQLGSMYAAGDDVPEDGEEAVRWYRLAAEQGDVSAQLRLGLMYSTGQVVPEDIVLAYMWYNLAATQDLMLAPSSRNSIEERMTPEQIAEAQRLSTEWIEEHGN